MVLPTRGATGSVQAVVEIFTIHLRAMAVGEQQVEPHCFLLRIPMRDGAEVVDEVDGDTAPVGVLAPIVSDLLEAGRVPAARPGRRVWVEQIAGALLVVDVDNLGL